MLRHRGYDSLIAFLDEPPHELSAFAKIALNRVPGETHAAEVVWLAC